MGFQLEPHYIKLELTIEEFQTLSALRHTSLTGLHPTRNTLENKFRKLEHKYGVIPGHYKDRLV